jgi:hypothetical protein
MKTTLNTLHHQDGDWMRELEFYKEEIAILTNRLEEVASKNTETKVTSLVEHYQNKFIMLREQLDTLNHDIKIRETGVRDISKDKPEHINEKMTVTKDQVQQRMKGFTTSFADTRFEFNKFLSETL